MGFWSGFHYQTYIPSFGASLRESESVWFLLNSHAAVAPVGLPWQTGQYRSIQGLLLGTSLFSGLCRAFWHYES